MIAGLSLCRYQMDADAPRLGLVKQESLYDLTGSGRPEYASLQAWLTYASGSVEAAIDALDAVLPTVKVVASLAQLLDPAQEPRCLAPIDAQEVWACGVTYEMSREARMRESEEPTIYGRVYDAQRPEVFFKATPHRVVGPGEAVAIREDSSWDVPEPEMVLVVTPNLEIVGYTVGNDMSSRQIEGDNPLYLPQAKVYDRCCALGPMIRLAHNGLDPLNQAVTCTIRRNGEVAFEGQTNTKHLHRAPAELVSYLGRCNSFPAGVLVCTGTGIVPPDSFTLNAGDMIEITFDGLGTLSNSVIQLPIVR